MNINWKVRFRNKTWIITFVAAVLSLLYQIFGMLGIAPPVSQDTLTNILMMIVNLLVMLGVIVDPTTSGVIDSTRALTYDRPNGDKSDDE